MEVWFKIVFQDEENQVKSYWEGWLNIQNRTVRKKRNDW